MSIESMLADYAFVLSESSNESDTRVLSARISVDDFYFIQAIADFYNNSRSSVAQDLLRESLQEVFDKLPASSRLSIATASQDLYIADVKKTAEEEKPGVPFEFRGRLLKYFVFARSMSRKMGADTDE